MNKFYKVDQVYKEKFYQLPQVLFTSEKYKDMSNDARVMYALLKDRNSYSIRNHWFDDDGNIYFIFTNDELMKMLNCGKGKLSKIKKELIQKELLTQKRTGLNKPNKLYLLRPEVSVQDVYAQEKEEQRLENQTPEAVKQEEVAKAKSKIISVAERTGQKPEDHEDENYFDIFNKPVKLQIKLITKNSELDAADIKNIIFKAKSKALHDNDIKVGGVLDAKDFQHFIETTLHGAVKAMKTDKGVNNLRAYLFTSFYKGFCKFAQLYNEETATLSFEELSKVKFTEDELMDFYKSAEN